MDKPRGTPGAGKTWTSDGQQGTADHNWLEWVTTDHGDRASPHAGITVTTITSESRRLSEDRGAQDAHTLKRDAYLNHVFYHLASLTFRYSSVET